MIKKYPLTSSFILTIFKGSYNSIYSISRTGNITVGNSLEHNFMNTREIFNDHYMVNQINEEKCSKILKEAEIEYEGSALEYLTQFLIGNGWEYKIELTRIIVPKPQKKLTGKKINLEFCLYTPDFDRYGNFDLDVYMTYITRTSKNVKFSVNIPKNIYDKCMEDPEVTARPKRTYIEADTLSTLFTEMEIYCKQAAAVVQVEKDAENSKKVICINFNSTEALTRDDLNHAYTGQKIETKFNFFVAYQTINSGFSRYNMFTFKKFNSGVNNTIKGIVDTGKSKNWIMNKPSVIIEWTQERENFLIKLEDNFRKLSENLNLFLKDIDAEKLEHLITNSENIKLLN